MYTISLKDIEYIISRACGSNFQVLGHRLEPFSKEKDGILGCHYLLSIDIQDEFNKDNVKTHTFFAKTRPDSQLVLDNIMDDCLFVEEINFFKEIHPKLMENYKGLKWSPQCYLANDDILVFEDLREQGYALRSTVIFDEESLKSALSTMARFHASTLLAETKLRKRFDEMYPDTFAEKCYSETKKFAKATSVGYETIALIAKRFGWDTSLPARIYKKVTELVRSRKGKFNVICHCDLWKNNIMFDNSVPPKCIIVDYQLLRYISPAIDFGMLFYIQTTLKYRQKSEYDMLRYYYTVLRDTVLHNNNKAKLPSYEDFLKEYKEFRIVGMAYGAMYLPGLYMKTEYLMELFNDPKTLNSYMNENRYGLIEKNMNEDPIYEQKIKEIMKEFLEEGKRVCQ